MRIAKLKIHMKACGITALLVTKRENIRYLTGFTGSSGAVLIFSGKTCLVTDFRYALQARKETSGITILIQKKDLPSALAETAARFGPGRIWFDESSLTVDGLRKLKKQGMKMIGAEDLIGVQRQCKDNRELACIRKAVRRAEESFCELRMHIRPGATERELGLKLEMLMREKGSIKAAFDIIVASGKNGAMPHASVTNRRIKNGDLVTFDFGAEASGYFSDITRTVCVGKPSGRQREIHELVLSAQRAALSAIKVGVMCKSVDAAARTVIEDAGFGKEFGHGTGHGIGLMVHECPSLSRLSKDRLMEGMVFSVEPGVYISGWGGVRIEDMVSVTDDGVEVLTSLSREIVL